VTRESHKTREIRESEETTPAAKEDKAKDDKAKAKEKEPQHTTHTQSLALETLLQRAPCAEFRLQKGSAEAAAFAESTDARAGKLLAEIEAFAAATRKDVNDPTTISAYVEHRRLHPRRPTKTGRLEPTSVRTIAGALIGAYRQTAAWKTSIKAQDLMQSTQWKRALRGWDREVFERPLSEGIFPVHREVVEKALATLRRYDCQTARYLILWWALCARPGDTAQLADGDLLWTSPIALTVTFRRGKAVIVRGGPYSVHTVIPEDWSYIVKNTASPNSLKEQERVHQMAMRTLLEIDPKIQARSMRRGALQTLALSGAKMETLLCFSGHRNEKMLLRYLDWGRHYGRARILGEQAAKNLWSW
jgi:hypothetical protein